MKRLLRAFLFILATSFVAGAAERIIVRTGVGAQPLRDVCKLLGCTVVRGLDGTLGKVFLVTLPIPMPLNLLQLNLSVWLGPVSVELDLPVSAYEHAQIGAIPNGLSDRQPVNYFGSTVWNGYAAQPASGIIRAGQARQQFGADGAGVVAVIDTGVDRNHPALASILLPGYDFVRNVPQAADEDEGDVTQSVSPVLDGGPVIVSPSVAAVLNPLNIQLLSKLATPAYGAFGHGTMVAGVVHLVAPKARIMPLRAFKKDGSGYLSDIIRAIYYASERQADIVNMSFSITNPSAELDKSVDHAQRQGVVLIAAAGNGGNNHPVWPAASPGVIGVASTNYFDQRSSFSSYGSHVWVAAPGESIVTTYPFGSYAAASGTSFSAPMVSGAIALLLDVRGNLTQAKGAEAIAHARYISAGLGNGRIDISGCRSRLVADARAVAEAGKDFEKDLAADERR